MKKLANFIIEQLVLESNNKITLEKLNFSEAVNMARHCVKNPLSNKEDKESAFEQAAGKMKWWESLNNVEILAYKNYGTPAGLQACQIFKKHGFVYLLEAAKFQMPEECKNNGLFADLLAAICKYYGVRELVWQAADGGNGRLSAYYEKIKGVTRSTKYAEICDHTVQFLYRLPS